MIFCSLFRTIICPFHCFDCDLRFCKFSFSLFLLVAVYFVDLWLLFTVYVVFVSGEEWIKLFGYYRLLISYDLFVFRLLCTTVLEAQPISA